MSAMYLELHFELFDLQVGKAVLLVMRGSYQAWWHRERYDSCTDLLGRCLEWIDLPQPVDCGRHFTRLSKQLSCEWYGHLV